MSVSFKSKPAAIRTHNELLTAIHSKAFLQLITLILQDFTEIMNNFMHNTAMHTMHTKNILQNRLYTMEIDSHMPNYSKFTKKVI